MRKKRSPLNVSSAIQESIPENFRLNSSFSSSTLCWGFSSWRLTAISHLICKLSNQHNQPHPSNASSSYLHNTFKHMIQMGSWPVSPNSSWSTPGKMPNSYGVMERSSWSKVSVTTSDSFTMLYYIRYNAQQKVNMFWGSIRDYFSMHTCELLCGFLMLIMNHLQLKKAITHAPWNMTARYLIKESV